MALFKKGSTVLYKVQFKEIYRRNKYVIFKIVTNPYLLSGIVAIAITISLPSIFNKYKVELIKRDIHSPSVRNFYADLNSDGISEQIQFGQAKKNFFYVIVRENNKIIDEWNFQGHVLLSPNLAVSSLPNDSLRFFYFFNYRNGKLFLNGLNPFENRFIVKNKFITNYNPKEKYIDTSPRICSIFKSKEDSEKKIYFFFNTGYSEQPREVFVFNPANDRIRSSTISYATLIKPFIADTTKNRLNLIFATYSTGNSKLMDPYSDRYSWLMCFDQNLTFKHAPQKIGYYPSKSILTPLYINGDKYFVVMNIYSGMKNHLCSLRLYNTNMQLIREKDFPFSPDWNGSYLYTNLETANYFYVIKENGVIDKLDSKFRVIKKIKIPPLHNTEPFVQHIGNKSLLIFQSEDLKRIIIAQNDFLHYELSNNEGMEVLKYCSVKLNGREPSDIILASNKEELTILYHFNPFYYFKYPADLIIYLVVLGLILIIEKGQKHRAELKYETERKIAGLQLQSVKSQMDPHFTLNILNSIGSLNYKQDRDHADYVFGKYSKLLRMTILRSDKILTTLAEELDYVKNYLELEQYRFNNKFTWKIDFEEGINFDIKIPKMLIHTFVENAIKHGLRHLERDGELIISIKNQSGKYLITVRDNGIGRGESEKIEFANTGKGLGILEQILDLYYNLMHVRITYNIDDIVDNNAIPNGTKALIKIPVTDYERTGNE